MKTVDNIPNDRVCERAIGAGRLSRQGRSRRAPRVVDMLHRSQPFPASVMPVASAATWQRGIGNSWMLLTIGLMIGFVLGFVLFLSRLPEEQYTLVETERMVEEFETADSADYEFYDRLSDSGSPVPEFNDAANQMPAFSGAETTGNSATARRASRAPAVELTEDLEIGVASVQPIEVAATGAAARAVASQARVVKAESQARQQAQPVKQVSAPTVVKRVRENAATAYYLQAGAFTHGGDAERMQRELNRTGLDAFVRTVAINGKQWHRVRIGPFYDADSLYQAQTRLGRSGISYLVIKVQS